MPFAVHPGRLLKRELKARAFSANRLAFDLGVPSGRITDILNGRRSITAGTAVRLGRYVGQPCTVLALSVEPIRHYCKRARTRRRDRKASSTGRRGVILSVSRIVLDSRLPSIRKAASNHSSMKKPSTEASVKCRSPFATPPGHWLSEERMCSSQSARQSGPVARP